jgi:hypothetical protein
LQCHCTSCRFVSVLQVQVQVIFTGAVEQVWVTCLVNSEGCELWDTQVTQMSETLAMLS